MLGKEAPTFNAASDLLIMNTETKSTHHLLQQEHINLGVIPC